MSLILFPRFLFHSFGAFLTIIQIVSNGACASNDLSTTLNLNNTIQDGMDVISFDFLGRPPLYPAGGDFGKRTIDLGGLKVHEAFYFKKIWDAHMGGLEGDGVSFYEPTSIPDGFHLLGHYSQPNSMPMFSSVLTAKDTTGNPSNGALKSPLDYTLIWTSDGLNVSQIIDGYIWLPKAPNGYKAVGHVVTTSPIKPTLNQVKCVRNDFTDLTEVDEWFWGFKYLNNPIFQVDLYTTKPVNRELSVPVGTFLARGGGSDAHDLACLKMIKSDPYSAMPNSLQIKTMINAYAPLVYFHPEEEYFPSSVLWFFQNGAELYQTGQNKTHVINDGDNLPNNGSQDDAFLDLPSDQANKERVKKGFLADAVAYIHVKPALGGTFTDLAIWLYYPFNGGGKFQLGPFVIDLGIIGEHVSDWEHMTLRIDNYHGILKVIYLSQHAKGKWLTAQEFEFKNGTNRPVVYASLHGHSHYNTPSYHIHLEGKLDSSTINMLYDEFKTYPRKSPIVNADKFLGFGVRDDAEKCNLIMDIASSYNVICVDYKPIDMEPWLNYTGRWGPKITYKFTKEVIKAISHLPEKVKALAMKLLYKLPPELLGEEGPPGPKMKDSWIGDERV